MRSKKNTPSKGRAAAPELQPVQQVVYSEATVRAAYEVVRKRSRGVRVRLAAEEGGTIGAADFARQLGIPTTGVRVLRSRKQIFAFHPGSRSRRYPSWQIYRGKLLPALDRVLAILATDNTSAFGTALFFLTPAEALDDRRPLDLLRHGEIDEVLLHAQRCADRH